MKRLSIAVVALGGVGLLGAVGLTIAQGVEYRIREVRGLDPLPAPELVANLTYLGLGLFVLAVVAITVLGVIAMVRRRRAIRR